MKRTLPLFSSPAFCLLACMAALAQSGPVPTAAAGQGQPVSYASVTQLNALLGDLDSTSKKTQSDLVKLRIEHWKADNSYKKQMLGNVDSIQRNLQGALPEIMGQLHSAPEDLSSTFKLYRNLDALYDVLGGVVEGAGAFGSKDDMQMLSNDLSSFEGTRKQLGERIENLSSSKEAELTRLHAELKTLQSQIQAEPPKKIVVDDTEPAKKPAPKKKTTAKPKPDASKAPESQPTQPQSQPQ